MEIAILPRYFIASTADFISIAYYNVCSWLESAANRNLRGSSDLRSFVADQVLATSTTGTDLPIGGLRLQADSDGEHVSVHGPATVG
jgi:hypothetical protein